MEPCANCGAVRADGHEWVNFCGRQDFHGGNPPALCWVCFYANSHGGICWNCELGDL